MNVQLNLITPDGEPVRRLRDQRAGDGKELGCQGIGPFAKDTSLIVISLDPFFDFFGAMVLEPFLLFGQPSRLSSGAAMGWRSQAPFCDFNLKARFSQALGLRYCEALKAGCLVPKRTLWSLGLGTIEPFSPSQQNYHWGIIPCEQHFELRG